MSGEEKLKNLNRTFKYDYNKMMYGGLNNPKTATEARYTDIGGKTWGTSTIDMTAYETANRREMEERKAEYYKMAYGSAAVADGTAIDPNRLMTGDNLNRGVNQIQEYMNSGTLIQQQHPTIEDFIELRDRHNALLEILQRIIPETASLSNDKH